MGAEHLGTAFEWPSELADTRTRFEALCGKVQALSAANAGRVGEYMARDVAAGWRSQGDTY